MGRWYNPALADERPDTSPERPTMNEILFDFDAIVITPWKLIGYLGTLLFTARWLVQFYATRKHKRVVMPAAFWWLSVCGSLMLLSYFTFGKNDSVGVLSNLFPAFISTYNLIVELRHRRSNVEEGSSV
jgi:lipid-A-disaccharide synthase-like uncharacterized protein